MGDDLISRQVAMDALEKKKDKKSQGDIGGFYNKIIQNDIDTLMLLPTADRPQEWVPCSERLPEPNQYVLVTYKTTDEIHICQYYGDGSENPWYSLIDECCAWNNVVLAWMPLPKPYERSDT